MQYQYLTLSEQRQSIPWELLLFTKQISNRFQEAIAAGDGFDILVKRDATSEPIWQGLDETKLEPEDARILVQNEFVYVVSCAWIQHQCGNCHKVLTSPMTCNKCEAFLYCTTECMHSDWSRHKQYCSQPNHYNLPKISLEDKKWIGDTITDENRFSMCGVKSTPIE
jgi:hypothetical protein